MKNFLYVIIASHLFFMPGMAAGDEERETAPKGEPGRGEPLSPDEFSKAFTKPVFRDRVEAAEEKDEQEDPEDLPFSRKHIGKAPFNSDPYREKTVPQDLMAGQIARDHDYFWLPRWHFQGRGGVNLPDAALSQDASMMAIIENVPRPSGTSGSVIVFINTWNWTISRIHYFPDKLLTRVYFVPGSFSVLAWEELQKDVTSRALHIINIMSGHVEDSSAGIPDAISGLAISPSGEKIFLKTKNNEPEYYVFKTDRLSRKPVKRECGMTDGFLIVADNRLVMIGSEKIRAFRLEHDQKTFEGDNPAGEIPDTAVSAGEGKFAFSSYMKPAYLYVLSTGQSKLLDKSSGRAMNYRDDPGLLAFETLQNREVRLVNLTDFSEIPGIMPAKVRPPTGSGALMLAFLEHHGRYLVLDTDGNLCLYQKPGRKWQKEIIFSAQKKVE